MFEPCNFSRPEYLASAKEFEALEITDPDTELCQFSDDAEDLAIELAYTRYALAKAEKEIEARDLTKRAPENIHCFYFGGEGCMNQRLGAKPYKQQPGA